MPQQVIHIFGASGSGTSTLGSYVSSRLGCFFMDTDDYFWEPTDPPFQVKRTVSARLTRMEADILSQERVVLSGALAGWGDPLIPLFTLAVRLETDTDLRLARIRQRERARWGSRIDIGGDMYQTHSDFLTWAAAYDTGSVAMRSKAKHDLWQETLPCPVLCLNGAAPPEENFRRIQSYLTMDR